jgi:hypothetical protein
MNYKTRGCLGSRREPIIFQSLKSILPALLGAGSRFRLPKIAYLTLALATGAAQVTAQTLYVPGAVGTSPNGNVGVGTATPAFKLDVAGDIRATGNLIEKKVTFTPTTVGWYRILSAATGQAGGTIRTSGAYDGNSTGVELVFSIRGWGQGGSITMLKPTGVNGNLINKVRVSTDGGAAMYLDIFVSTASAPAPITIFGFGPDLPAFVASPVVGAIVGSASVRVLPVGYYEHFSTTGSLVTYSNDGSTTQGYIYHGSSGQAAFGNGVVNGETWITRAGGGGSIKLGEYDLNTAYLTVAGGSGNVGIGTTSPTHKLAVKGTIRANEVIVDTGWSDYVFDENYPLAPLAEVEVHIREKKHLPGIPTAQEVSERGVSLGEMQARLLAKIEELTLHQIAQEKEIARLTAEVAELRDGNVRASGNEELQTRPARTIRPNLPQ